MTNRRWGLLACCAVALLGAALAGMLVFGRSRERPAGAEEKKMSDTRFTVNHVRVTTDRPFEDVSRAFERQLGRFDPEVYKALAAAEEAEVVRAKIEGMAGPSGFMLFGTNDHGSLLRLAGQKRKAIQYVVGNPLFALQMTRHDVRAALYAPLRVLLYEEEGRTCVEYDRPSSLLGQFGDDRISPTAAMLDRKLEALVSASFE
jgi:uncharacterized protein (DUF302 family)